MNNIHDDEIMVSILCSVFNHGNFIRQTLEGFVMQKTNFAFEVIVHDDASTDCSVEIIREFEEKYPNIIVPIYQKKNLYSQGINRMTNYMLPKARGRYLAWCEGDDYWIDPYKLQLQVDALNANPDCAACICKVENVQFDGTPRGTYFPKLNRETGIIESVQYINYTLYPEANVTLPWQLSGFMVRREIYEEYVSEAIPYKQIFSKIHVGDLPLFLYVGLQGNIYYINKTMSCYRTGNPNSYVGKSNESAEKRINNFRIRIEALQAFDEGTNGRFHDAVTEEVQNCNFLICKRKHDIKSMKKEIYKDYYNCLSKKSKMAAFLFYYFPWCEKSIRKLANINKLRQNRCTAKR